MLSVGLQSLTLGKVPVVSVFCIYANGLRQEHHAQVAKRLV